MLSYSIFIIVIIQLIPTARSTPSVITEDYLFEDPTCHCNVGKTEAFWSFIDTSNMVNILIAWNPSVYDFKSTPWYTVRDPKVPASNIQEFNRTCTYNNGIHRVVDYKTMVKAPVFLRPFVSDRKIHQTKQQVIYNCFEEGLLIFTEDCVIDDIPIIPNIEIKVQSMMSHNEKPIAIATLKHNELPWYMKFIQGMLHDEIISKAKSLWKLTLKNLCQCV